jgi:ATP-dependent RNA helicase DDX51/DBP6
VVPSKDLVLQVKRVFDSYCHAVAVAVVGHLTDARARSHALARTGLKVVALSGQNSVAKERQQLLGEQGRVGGYASGADIVVATPGRLVEHLRNTQGFCVAHLRFLVIDEAGDHTHITPVHPMHPGYLAC